MVRYLVDNYNPEIFITPNQDLLFGNISESEKKYFENDMMRLFGYGFRTACTNDNGYCEVNKKRRYTPLRLLSGSCVGKDTCRLAYTDSEKFEPHLIDTLEPRWGHMSESIGVTGCERQCLVGLRMEEIKDGCGVQLIPDLIANKSIFTISLI